MFFVVVMFFVAGFDRSHLLRFLVIKCSERHQCSACACVHLHSFMGLAQIQIFVQEKGVFVLRLITYRKPCWRLEALHWINRHFRSRKTQPVSRCNQCEKHFFLDLFIQNMPVVTRRYKFHSVSYLLSLFFFGGKTWKKKWWEAQSLFVSTHYFTWICLPVVRSSRKARHYFSSIYANDLNRFHNLVLFRSTNDTEL